ncbi:MAG TPA: hypothetical protein VGR89_10015, partial [Puia sp.]|nr:hypothetical protein [Puia sp.]
MRILIPFIRRTVGLYLIVVLAGQAVKAQSGPSNQSTKSYDTTLSSDGFGIYHLQFPQFSPDSGTLVSVRISALTNTMYGFTLRNADSISETYTLTVGLQDQFSGSALPATYSNVVSQPLGNFPLSPGQQVTQAPMSLMANHVSTDTVNAVGSFAGTGKVSLKYQAFTFTNLNSMDRASYYYSAAITNALTFTVQYIYNKNSVVLPTDVTGWTA